MDEGQVTLNGGGWWVSPHRSVEISKVENGYSVKAAFVEKVASEDGMFAGGERFRHKVFVFYTEPEVVKFVKDYLDADAEDLKS